MDEYTMDRSAQRRLDQYFTRIGAVLGDKRRRASFATYAMGLLSEGERKSMEPIAARASGEVARVDAAHQRIQHFVSDGLWDDHAVRRESAGYALAAMQKQEPVAAWILDDTGFLKQGTHSVGVQRQYTGSAGKVTNCQIGVSLSLATKTRHLPTDFELYIPKVWTEDPDRRREAKIPYELRFRTKPELALDMIQRAVADGRPRAPVLGDSAYGTNSTFRMAIRSMGLDYALAIDNTTKCWQVDRLLRRRGEPLTAKQWAAHRGKEGFRRTTWREGTSEKLSARFAFMRVVPFHDDGIDPAVREDVWLIMEWEDGESAPTKFYFATLPPSTSHKQLIRTIKMRWRTERVYQDLKGELGLDHFEGRSFRGWHHHVSVVLCCYAFIVAESSTAFPPSAGEEAEGDEDRLAA
jgi:SRSO17 transposase